MHDIDMSNNRANMAWTGKTPWHGLGQQVDPDSTIDEWKIAAGLNWVIEKRPLAFGKKSEDGAIIPAQSGLYAHVRNDTQEMLGYGTDRFNIVQPGDVLEFYRDLVEGTDFSIETAGALNGGKRIWALAKSNMEITLDGKDRLLPYLLLATANDGTMSTVCEDTTVRVVCRNTLQMAVGTNGGKAKIRVPHSRQFDADEVKADLGIVQGRVQAFAADADRLAQTAMSDEQAIEFFVNLIAKKDGDDVTNEKHVKNVTAKLIRSFRTGPGADLSTSRNTAWGAVNAVTNYVDFSMRAQSADNRFNSSQFGIGAELKRRAFDEALAVAA